MAASLVAMLGGSLAYAEPDPPPHGTDEATAPPLPPHEPTGMIMVGGGWSTDDHLVVHGSIMQRRLFGTSNLLALDALVSARRQLFELRFVHPSLAGSQWSLATTLASDRQLLPGFTRKATERSAILSRPIADHVRAYVGYGLEQVHVEDVAPSVLARGNVEPAPRDLVLSSLRAGLTYSTLDSQLMPLRGTSAGFGIDVADPRLGSTVQLTKFHGWANTHQAFGPFTLHLGTTVAAVGSRDPMGVPLSERLFLDGSMDIRGYAPGSLGPAAGGTFELTGHASLELPVARRIGLSTEGFLDAGTILDNHGHGQLGHSTGVGVIWRSPIGALHFDVAFPLEGGPPRFVLGLGG